MRVASKARTHFTSLYLCLNGLRVELPLTGQAASAP